MKLDLTPFASDPAALGTEAGATTWAARTDDPIFIAKPANGGRLRAGWHSATIELQPREGQIVEPRLYLPDGSGRWTEARSVPMAGEGATYSAEFHLAHAVDHVRFDPSRAPCVFACESLHVERTRRVETLVEGVRSAARSARHQVARLAGRPGPG